MLQKLSDFSGFPGLFLKNVFSSGIPRRTTTIKPLKVKVKVPYCFVTKCRIAYRWSASEIVPDF